MFFLWVVLPFTALGGTCDCTSPTKDEFMTNCNDVNGNWDYGYWDGDTFKYSTTDPKWDELCTQCKNFAYSDSSPINVDTTTLADPKDLEANGVKLEPVTFSMPSKFGKFTGYSYKLENSVEGLTIMIPDGVYNKDQNDDGKENYFTTNNFRVWGGALGKGKSYCIKKIVIKWAGYDDGDKYPYKGSEHTIDDKRYPMETQFWSYDCDKYEWRIAKQQGKVAAFSTLFDEASEDYGSPYTLNDSLYKILKYYVKNERTARRRLGGGSSSGGGACGDDGIELTEDKTSRRRLAGSGDSGTDYFKNQEIDDHSLQCSGASIVMKSANFPTDDKSCGPLQYVHIHELLPSPEDGKISSYYYYQGGFTTPEDGCKSGMVKWHIFSDVKKVKELKQNYLKYMSKYIFSSVKDKDGNCSKESNKYGRYRPVQNKESNNDYAVYKVTSSAPTKSITLLLLASVWMMSAM